MNYYHYAALIFLISSFVFAVIGAVYQHEAHNQPTGQSATLGENAAYALLFQNLSQQLALLAIGVGVLIVGSRGSEEALE